jgi:hypothetical protein
MVRLLDGITVATLEHAIAAPAMAMGADRAVLSVAGPSGS